MPEDSHIDSIGYPGSEGEETCLSGNISGSFEWSFNSEIAIKKQLKSIKTTAFQRAAALSKTTLIVGAKTAGFALGELAKSKDQRQNRFERLLQTQAELIRDELSRLKGTAMKAGQMLSLIGEHFLPEEVLKTLRTLQAESDPLAWEEISRVLSRYLGRERIEQLSIQQEAYTAASIGQVHRATIKETGEEICLKIQYPGVAAAVDSDLSTIRRLLQLTKLLPKGESFDPIFDEVRTVLKRETDYLREAKYTEFFREKLSHDPRYLVPEVFRDWTTKRVLATRFEDGIDFRSEEFQKLDQATRDKLGQAIVELFFYEFLKIGVVQTDPHLGNYRIRLTDDDPVLILFDFGAVRRYPQTFIEPYKNLLISGLANDRDRFVSASQQLGFLKPGDDQAVVQCLYDFVRLALEPYYRPNEVGYQEKFSADGTYSFRDTDLYERIIAQARKLFWAFKGTRAPPKEVVFFDRKVAGIFWTLSYLKPNLNLRDSLERFLA